MSDALVGRVLSGAYRVEARLGAGGMGAVYAARHVRTGRAYAVKVLLPELAARTEALARFRREAHALAALGHAHIVAVHDFDQTEDGLAFLVMDRLEGEDLAARLRRGPLSIAHAVAVADAIASALEAAHGIGLVHRDLKPGNVFLAQIPGAPERPVLLDFGLAKSLAVEPAQAITSTGVVMGTPHYMAPEQAQGGAIDGRTDLYALGAILFELVTGRPPFDGPTIASLFVKILTAPAPSLRSHGIAHDGLDAIVQRCLAKDPRDRLESASAVRRALASLGDVRASGFAPTIATTSAASGAGPSVAPMTRASPPQGASATPIGNAFASSIGTPQAIPGVARPRGLALAAGAAAALLMLTTAVAAIGAAAYVFGGRGAPPPAPIASSAPLGPDVEPPVSTADAGTAAGSDAATTTGSASAAAPATDSAPVPDSDSATDSDAPRSSRPRRARSASTGPAPSVPIPPGVDTTAPGFDQGLAARGHISSGDWRGCLQALEGASPTLDNLWLRASCAHHAGDRRALERTCETLTQRFPSAPQTSTCPALLQTL